jgi:hypothetical protein
VKSGRASASDSAATLPGAPHSDFSASRLTECAQTRKNHALTRAGDAGIARHDSRQTLTSDTAEEIRIKVRTINIGRPGQASSDAHTAALPVSAKVAACGGVEHTPNQLFANANCRARIERRGGGRISSAMPGQGHEYRPWRSFCIIHAQMLLR